MSSLRDAVEKEDKERRKSIKEKTQGEMGYGGKFGVQKDRMDKSAVGHDYVAKVNILISITIVFSV